VANNITRETPINDMESITEPTAEPQETSPEKALLTKRIITGLLDGKPKSTIAKELGITRQTVYNYLKDSDTRDILLAELEGIKAQHLEKLNEMADSEDPVLVRAAIQERGKLLLKLIDKTNPNLNQNQNINLNINIDLLEQFKQQTIETLNRLPPTTRQQFWNTYNQIQQEWKTPT